MCLINTITLIRGREEGREGGREREEERESKGRERSEVEKSIDMIE